MGSEAWAQRVAAGDPRGGREGPGARPRDGRGAADARRACGAGRGRVLRDSGPARRFNGFAFGLPQGYATPKPSALAHVFQILMEDKSASEVIRGPAVPLINRTASRYVVRPTAAATATPVTARRISACLVGAPCAATWRVPR
jgi:hypothetical protein